LNLANPWNIELPEFPPAGKVSVSHVSKKSLTLPAEKAEHVSKQHGIAADVCIRVDPSIQASGITFHVSTYDRVVVAIPVLIQPGLGLVVLSREAQVVDD
jgi:hypothetical protein